MSAPCLVSALSEIFEKALLEKSNQGLFLLIFGMNNILGK